LNIDHALRSRLDTRMIRTDTDETSMRESLEDVVELFELAQNTVFKLMASVSLFRADSLFTVSDDILGLCT
jgi:GTPase-activating protein SST2